MSDYNFFSIFWFMLIPFLIFDVVLKGIALYKSAGKKQKLWFIALLIVNSAGILPLIYLILEHFSSKPTKIKK